MLHVATMLGTCCNRRCAFNGQTVSVSQTHLCADDKADVGEGERVRRADVARVVGVDHVGVKELGRRIAEAVPLNLKAKQYRVNEHCRSTKQQATTSDSRMRCAVVAFRSSWQPALIALPIPLSQIPLSLFHYAYPT